MQIDGAIIEEQGITFAIVVVKGHVLSNSHSANQAQDGFAHLFPGMPIVLMAQDARGIPEYYGRHDIVDFLASIDCRRIPWKTYTVN